jgi:ABC-type Fe3+-hydroxamate transport system substrate-binding protein
VLTKARTVGHDPADLDRQVREAAQAGTSLYELDVDLLKALAPDVILTQDLCSACSVDLSAVRRAAGAMPRPPTIVSLSPETVEGVLDDVLRVGEAIGIVEAATRAAVAMRERLFAASEHVNPFDDGPSVAFLEWTSPLFVGGHWVPQLIERAGGRHPLNPTVARETAGAAIGPQMAARFAGKSVTASADAFAASKPDWIIICPCGVELHAAIVMAKGLAQHAWFRETPAARFGRVVVVDGNQMFARPGPRLADAFEFLIGLLNERPDLIPPDFPWVRLG